jgi:Ca2+-binding EF-hand superfamily protein
MHSWVPVTLKTRLTPHLIDKQAILDQESIDDFTEMFQRFDVDKDGFLTYRELLKGMGQIFTESEV